MSKNNCSQWDFDPDDCPLTGSNMCSATCSKYGGEFGDEGEEES